MSLGQAAHRSYWNPLRLGKKWLNGGRCACKLETLAVSVVFLRSTPAQIRLRGNKKDQRSRWSKLSNNCLNHRGWTCYWYRHCTLHAVGAKDKEKNSSRGAACYSIHVQHILGKQIHEPLQKSTNKQQIQSACRSSNLLLTSLIARFHSWIYL